MLVLCAYLSAMAGITALCYVFRKHSDEAGEGDPSLLNMDEDEDAETQPYPSATGDPDIMVTLPPGDKTKPRTRSALTPETQAMIQEVLDFVNTPCEQLVLGAKEKQSEATAPKPPLKLPMYGSTKMKKPKEVIEDIKQSQAKVEAWISTLGKVINDDAGESTERQEKRTRGPGSVSGSVSGAIKPNMLAANCEARKNAHSERLAKVKEEMAKRRTVLGSKAETAAAKRREDEEKPAVARKKWPLTSESGSGGSYKREVIEVPKRAHETNNAAAAARKRPSALGSSKGSINSSENTATSREEREAAMKASRSRPTAVRRAPVEDKEQRASRQEAVKTEAAQKAKTQTKPVSSFEVRMKYVPPGTKPRSPSPPKATDARNHAQQAASKIPVMINSRVRPPVARTARVPREPKPLTPVVQRPKKSIRITHDPPLPSRRVETPAPEVAVAARRSSSNHAVARERSRSGGVQDDAMVRHASCTREEVAEVVFPELNIIDVRGSRSCTPARNADVHAELHSAAREVAARIAKSGPIRLHKNSSFSRDRSMSIANLRAHVTPGHPVSVSKTVQLPEGTEDNVTVYFSVTMPRRGKSDINWNGHDDSDHTITVEDDGKPAERITEVEITPVEEELENVGTTMMEDDDHSDDGVFPEELSNFPDGSDNEIEVDYQSSISGYDGGEFDSCDEQF